MALGRIQHYNLERLIRETSKSIVYEATDENLNRRVAIKILKPGQNEKRKVQFINEGQRLARLPKHPRLVQVHSLSYHGENPFIVMEHVEGKDLEQIIKDGRIFTDQEVLDITRSISETLVYANSNQIHHHDIKPANIKMTGPKGLESYLVDFGGRLHPDPKSNDVRSIGELMKTLLMTRYGQGAFPKPMNYLIERCQEEGLKIEELDHVIKRELHRKSRRKFILGSAAALVTGGAAMASYFMVKKARSLETAKRRFLEGSIGYDELLAKIIGDKVVSVLEEGGIPRGKYPYVVTKGTNQWSYGEGHQWTDGCWPGILWMAYRFKKDSRLKAAAESWTEDLQKSDEEPSMNLARIYFANKQGLDTTGDKVYYERLRSAADLASKLYDGIKFKLRHKEDPTSNYCSTNILEFMIPLMSLNIFSGDFDYMVKRHLNTARLLNINEDGSSIELVEHENDRVAPKRYLRVTGMSGKSTPSKAQGRSIKGFLKGYQLSRDEVFLDTAIRCASFAVKTTSKSGVPNYDLKDDNVLVPDSGAGALIADGLIELYCLTKQEMWLAEADKILRTTIERHLQTEEGQNGILSGSYSNINDGSNIGGSHIHADYYLIKAIKRRINL